MKLIVLTFLHYWQLQLDVVGKKILFPLIFPRAPNEKKMPPMSNLDLEARIDNLSALAAVGLEFGQTGPGRRGSGIPSPPPPLKSAATGLMWTSNLIYEG